MENDQEMSGNHPETSENHPETSGKHPDNVPEVVQLLAKRPELRKELIKWVKSEFGFNVESILENYFGELPDKKLKLEEIDMPLREIAENVLLYTEDGYSPGQIASLLGIYPSNVSKVLKEKDKWETDIKLAARKKVLNNKKLPWYVRLGARLRLI